MKAEPSPFLKRAAGGLERALNVSIANMTTGAESVELGWISKSGSGSTNLALQPGVNELQLFVPDVDRIELTLQGKSWEKSAIHLPVVLPPAKKWKIYLLPTVHTDIGFTDLQRNVRKRHAENGMGVLKWLDEEPDFKWYSETFWQLNALLELHPEKADEVFARLREKRWGLSASYANTLTGLCSSEALNRLTLDSRNLANRAGFDLDSFVMDDVPSANGALPMVLAHSGIKYFIEGANIHHAVYAGQVPNPFYWEGPDGSRVLAEITSLPAYGAGNKMLTSTARAMDQVPKWLKRFQTNDYPYDAVLLNGGFGDNHQIRPWLVQVVHDWNAQWEYPKIIFAQPEDFFGYIEKHFSKDIPVLKTDFGGWWEVGAASSARETALSRRAEERAVTAEMLHSLASVMTGKAYPKTSFDGLWHNILLYNEHTWGSADSVKHPGSEKSVSEWDVKSGYAHQADAESRDLLASGMTELAAMAPAADWVVFNSLAWQRNGAVTTIGSGGAVEDIASGKIYPCQPLPEGGSCFVANDLPSIGYRTYRDAALPATVPDAVQISGNEMENEFYRVKINPQTGGIQSIYDKQLGGELVDTNGQHDLGELIYVVVGDGGPSPHDPPPNPPTLRCHRPVGTGIERIDGPVFGELDSDATNENFPKITLRVRLYRGLKQLDLIYDLDKTETTTNEAVYVAFPFALDAKEGRGGLWMEYPDEIMDPARDQHTSACRDWYSVQRWLAISDGADTVEVSPLDAPLFTVGGMTAETWQHELMPKSSHVFAYIMNNYWEDNYKASQGGHFVFRYSITSSAGAFSRRDAVIRGWNMFCPPVAGAGSSAREHPPNVTAADSLVSVKPMGLALTAIKEAEDAHGFVFRLCDYAGIGGRAKLTLPKPASEASDCNLVEMEESKIKGHGRQITVPMKRFAPATVKVGFAGTFPSQ